ncbi:unnamed protein product [Durusdinium trenchii]|uniref:Poly [ADP-ribose] polymerase n=1 Tax=Durusdinium trenchii TaxID=1381693 RepID=A0ABP0J2Z0_9DINO
MFLPHLHGFVINFPDEDYSEEAEDELEHVHHVLLREFSRLGRVLGRWQFKGIIHLDKYLEPHAVPPCVDLERLARWRARNSFNHVSTILVELKSCWTGDCCSGFHGDYDSVIGVLRREFPGLADATIVSDSVGRLKKALLTCAVQEVGPEAPYSSGDNEWEFNQPSGRKPARSRSRSRERPGQDARETTDLQEKLRRSEAALDRERAKRRRLEEVWDSLVRLDLKEILSQVSQLQEVKEVTEDSLQCKDAEVRELKARLSSEKENHQESLKQLEDVQKLLTASSEENEQLKAEVELLQKRTSSIATTQGAIWQYKVDGCWHAFPPEGNDQINEAYLTYLRDPLKSLVFINSAGITRRVDFKAMLQRRGDNGCVRHIRIVPGVPEQWTTPPRRLLLPEVGQPDSFYIKVTDMNIHAKVRDILQQSGHACNDNLICSCMSTAKVISVHRIENWSLWQGYKATRAALRQKHANFNISATPVDLDLDGSGTKIMTSHQAAFNCGDPLEEDLQEKILLHGTRWDNVDSIILNGFDPRTSRRGMYGEGVYFAAAACKSHQYTCGKHSSCCGCKLERTLIIARVTLGDAYAAEKTRRKERRPPVRDSALGLLYDSVVVNPGPIDGHHNETQTHQEMLMQHWQLAAIIPIPTLLALWGGWREGKRFNTKALLRSVLVLLLVSSIMGLGLFQASVLSIVAGSLALVWLPLVLIRHWLAHPLKDLSHGGEEAAPRGGSPEEEAAVAAYTAEVQV